MKENKAYPQIEEGDGGEYQSSGGFLTANEPVGAVACAETYEEVEFPCISGLPQTWEELLDNLKEGEEEFEHGEAIPWDVACKNLRKHIAEYAA